MKKIALAFGFLLTILSMAPAQRVCVQASPTWSWMKTTDKLIEGSGSNWGLKFGVIGEFPVGFGDNRNDDEKKIALMLGLNLAFNHGGTLLNGYPQGIFWPNTDLSSPLLDTLPKDAKLHYRITYLEIPFGLRLKTNPISRMGDTDMRIYFEVPFTAGFRLKSVGDIRGNTPIETEDEDIRKEVNGLAFSWGFGAGFEFDMPSNGAIVAGVQFQQQLTDMTDDGGSVYDSRDSSWKKEKSKGYFNAIALRLAYFF